MLVCGTESAERGSAGDGPSYEAVRRRWEKWVAVRDAPFPGHPWKYSKHQLEYHYTRNRAILRRVGSKKHIKGLGWWNPSKCRRSADQCGLSTLQELNSE